MCVLGHRVNNIEGVILTEGLSVKAHTAELAFCRSEHVQDYRKYIAINIDTDTTAGKIQNGRHGRWAAHISVNVSTVMQDS